MVQKDKFQSNNSFQKLILAFLIIFTVPLPLRSEIKIPIRKDCSLIKKNQNYDYYERQEAHDFGRKIQALIAKKDIRGIYKNVLIDELENGPRREFIKNKSFDEIFPKAWVNKVITTEIDCDSIGWRGFMISNGLIWFDRMGSGKWTIKSINGVNQEDFNNNDFIGWKTNKGIIPPTCFPTFGYFETPKVDMFSKKYNIKDKYEFRNSPGKFIGKEIPIGSQIESKINKKNIYSVTTNLNDCFKLNLSNGFLRKESRTEKIVVKKNTIYQSSKEKSSEEYDIYKSHYKVISKLDIDQCNKLGKGLFNKCKESYLIKIGYQTGGTIGWIGSYYIFGIFEDNNDEKYIIPLKNFYNLNKAINFIEQIY